MTRPPHILAVGGAHIDRRGTMSVAFVPGASNPGVMREDVGGGAFNALRTAARRGASGALFSVRGGDAAGEAVARAIAAAGIADLSAVFLDRATPSYTALLDQGGDVVAALADMGLYELAFPKQVRRSQLREALLAADALLTDANLPAAALERLVPLAAGRPAFAIAISPAKAVRLAAVAGRLSCLFMNRREAAALGGGPPEASEAGLVARLRQAGIARGVVTAGVGPVIGFDPDAVFSVQPPAPSRIADVTGAGDALAGAMIVALLAGRPFAEALREGVAAASLAVQSASAVPDLPPQVFAAALALVPSAQEVHDA